jgi:hypothetical protein
MKLAKAAKRVLCFGVLLTARGTKDTRAIVRGVQIMLSRTLP